MERKMNNSTDYEFAFALDLSNWSGLEPAKIFYYPGDHGVIPTVVFVTILATIGIIGNVQVLLVSFMKYNTKCTYITYVRALAIIDFLTCALHAPMEMLDLSFPYNFFNGWTCRLFRFQNSFLFLTSTFLLLAIAIDRYRHVCHPFRIQRTVSLARKFIVLCVFAAVVFSLPLFEIYGMHRVEIDFDVFAYECFVKDKYLGTVFPVIYIAMLYAIFAVVAVILIYTYASIGVTMHRQEKRRVELLKDVCECHFKSDCTQIRELSTRISTISTIPDPSEDSNGSQNNPVALRTRRQKRQLSRRFEVRKTTKILFLVTLIFIISYLPFITLSCVMLVNPHYKKNLNEVELSLNEMVLRLTLLNNVSNPFIYGIFDDRFKIASKELCRDLIGCFTRRRRSKVSSYKH